MIPPLIAAGAIGAGANLLGGWLSSNAAQDARAQNAMMQTVFAKNGIQWRVEDAKKAGIHPLYALGASTSSFAPSSVGDTFGASVANAGQDISRAITATQTQEERNNSTVQAVQMLQLERGGLQNELLRLQIRKAEQSLNPPLPSLPLDPVASDVVGIPRQDDFQERPRLALGQGEFRTDPGVSNAEDFEKRYGEMTDFTFGPYIAYKDYTYNHGGLSEHFRRFMERAAQSFMVQQGMLPYQNHSRWRGHY